MTISIMYLPSSFISATFTLLTFSVFWPTEILPVSVASMIQAVLLPQASMTDGSAVDVSMKSGIKDESGSGLGKTNRDEALSFTLPKNQI